jgi:hypothetical protein
MAITTWFPCEVQAHLAYEHNLHPADLPNPPGVICGPYAWRPTDGHSFGIHSVQLWTSVWPAGYELNLRYCFGVLEAEFHIAGLMYTCINLH